MRARARPANNSASMRMIGMGVVLALCGLLGTRSLSYLAFAGIALAPAICAAIIEKPGQRAATISIGSMTTATLVPLILGAIANGSSRDLLGSPRAWTFIAGAVLGGIGIYFVLPTITIMIDDSRAARRLRELQERQQKLEQDWGAEVRTNLGT
jgi:hypothetical protein